MERDDEIEIQDLFVARSVHRVSLKYRWGTVLLVPPLVALMVWAFYESMHNNLGENGEIQLWVVVLASLIFGGMTCVFLAAVVWAFRARVIIEGEQMTVCGAFSTTVVTADRMSGFRWWNGQFYLYLKDRRFAIQFGYLDDMSLIYRWIEARTTDIVGEFLQKEDAEIAADQSLGMTEDAKGERLQSLRNIIKRINYVVYLAGGVGVVNFLFVERNDVELIAVCALMLVPLYLDMLAFSNRGHVRIDYDEGSRYPQIFTGTMSAGVVLGLLSLLDRGALLDLRFYEILAAGILVKGLFWLYLDIERLKMLLLRSKAILLITVAAMFLVPGFWVGGSLYQFNKLFDKSPTTWHATKVLEKKVSSGRTTSYSVELAPWDSRPGPVEYTLRRKEFERFEAGMPVRVGVRDGALGIAWASALEPANNSSEVGP